MGQRKNEIIVKKGKNWKLTKVKSSGNYVVYFQGKQYIYHPAQKRGALQQIEAIKKVARITRKRK